MFIHSIYILGADTVISIKSIIVKKTEKLPALMNLTAYSDLEQNDQAFKQGTSTMIDELDQMNQNSGELIKRIFHKNKGTEYRDK